MSERQRKRKRPWPRFRAVKSKTRKYGYTVQDAWKEATWFTGPDCTGGWYKLKKGAEHRANVYNKAFEAGRLTT